MTLNSAGLESPANRRHTGRMTIPAIILPPREMFSPRATGAIGLLVHRLGEGAAIYGMHAQEPYTDRDFRPVRLPWWPGPLARRYAHGLARALHQTPPSSIEVHNRPDVALHLAAQFPDIPVILFLHNDPHGMRGARTPAERARLIDTMAHIAPVSAYIAARLTDEPGHPKVVPFANCIDLRSIPKAMPRNRILFAGRVVADKGADSFVAACAMALPRMPGWTAEIIGADGFGANSRDTPFLRTLRPKAEAAGIILHGWQPHEVVLAAMASAAITVMPSRWPEPFGLTALEAMACGSALICSNRGGLAEVTEDAAWPIDPDRPETIADAIITLARDPVTRASLARAGLARAAGFDLSWARERLEDLRTQAPGSARTRQG
jgi:glycosyltransferase involved in cell wall biosynthesis